jgi:hypothetical protein
MNAVTVSKQTLAAVAIAAAMAVSARAQMLHPGYGTVGAPMSNFISTSYLSNKVVNDTTFKRRVTALSSADKKATGVASLSSAPVRSVTFTAAGRDTLVPSQLAKQYPAASRSQAEHLFKEMLTVYGKLEDQYGIPKRDLGGAIAAFLFGSYTAYRNTATPDAHFKVLVEQMRGIIAENPGITGASDEQKQELYEQMAILGTLMATTYLALQKQPNAQTAANMRKAGKEYLEQFLRTDAERVQITAAGLSVR